MKPQPLDRGRVCFIAEKYETGQLDGHGQPERKARYAQIGRASLWPPQQQGDSPDISIELDSAPIAGSIGPVRIFIFWDSRDPNKNGQNNWGEPQDAPMQPQQNQQQQRQQPQQRQQSQPSYGGHRR